MNAVDGILTRRRRARRPLGRLLSAGLTLSSVLALQVAPAARAANTEYDVRNGQADLTVPGTYTTGGAAGTGAGGTVAGSGPTVSSDVTFDSGFTYIPAAFTLNSSQTFGSLNDLSGTALTIANASASGTGDTLTLGGLGWLGNAVPGSASADLLYVASGGSLTINSGAAGSATALGLVLGQSGNFDVAGTASIAAVISDGGSAFGINKTGAGTLTLSAANTYIGATSLNNGTLTLTGSLASTVFNLGGGTFNYTGAPNATQSFTTTNLTGFVSVNNTVSTDTLALGNLVRTTPGTVNFGTTTGKITSTAANPSGILGPWATIGTGTALSYAVANGAGIAISAYSSGTALTVTGGGTADVTNFTLGNAGVTLNASSPVTANTLQVLNTDVTAITLANGGNNITLNGILNSGGASGSLTISGTGSVLAGATKELDITTNANAVTINSVIANSAAGASSVVFTSIGGGSLTLGAANTYTGNTYINSGSVTPGNNATAFGVGGTIFLGAAGTSSAVTIVPGSSVTYANPITVEPGGRREIYTAGTPTPIFSGGVTLVGGATLEFGANGNSTMTLSGGATGTGNIIFGPPQSARTANIVFSGSVPISIIGTLSDNDTLGGGSNTGTVTVSAPVQGATAVLQNSATAAFILTNGSNSYTGNSTATAGALQANDGVGLPTTSFLVLSGGVLQSNGTASFTRSLGTSGNTFEFTASGGGFSANTGILTVNIGGSATPATVQWGSTVGSQIVGTLQFGSTTANAQTNWTNPIDLNAVTRTVNVTPNTTNGSGDSNVISGVIGTSGTAGLTKTGTGTLTLTGANTYNGATTVAGGALVANPGAGLPSASQLFLSGGVISPVNGGTFSLSLGATGTPGTVQINGGGFTAVGGPTTVNIGGNSTPSTVQWGSSASGTQIAGTLQLGSLSATAQTLFTNPLDLNGATRTINVTLGTGTDSDVISGVISNSGGTTAGALTVTGTGAGVLTLTGGNTYTGATTITSGVLATPLLASGGTASGIGQSTSAAGNLVLGGGTLRYTGAQTSTDHLFTLSNNSTLDASGTGAVNFSNSGSMGNGGTANTAYTLTLTGTSTATNVLAAIIGNNGTGATALTKTGVGTWNLTGNNTYTGATTITGGTLVLAGSNNGAGGLTYSANNTTVTASNANALGTGGIVVSGSFTGLTLNLTSGAPTTSANTLAFNSNGGQALTITLDAPSSRAGITQTFGALTLGQQATLTINQTGNFTSPSTVVFGNSTFSQNTASGKNSTIAPNGVNVQIGTMGNVNTGTAITNTLTLDGTSAGNSIGAISNNNGTGLSALTKSNTSTWTLNAVNTFTGPTTISGGTLVLGTTGTVGATLTGSAVSVGTGTLAVTPGVVTSTSNNIVSALTLNAGGNLNMSDGFTNTFNVTGAGTLAPAAGASPILSFDLGGAAAPDVLAIGGAGAVGAAKAIVNFTGIGATALTTSTPINFITAASGLTSTNFILGTPNVTVNGTIYHLALSGSGTQEAVTATAGFVPGSVANAFWTGSQSTGSWATVTANATNFSTDAAGLNNTYALPDLNTNVTFTANSAANLSSTLDQPFVINSLAFSGTGTSNTAGSTIAAGTGGAASTLTINAAALNGNAAGNGITVNAGSGAVSLAAPIILGAAQTWTNNSSNLLTVGPGAITNAANTLTVAGSGSTTISGALGNGTGGLTKTGAGTLTLSGADAYTGTTILNQGTLAFAAAQSLTGGLTFGLTATSTSTGILDLSTTPSDATFRGGLLVQTNSATANTISIGANKTLTLTGSALANVITVGSATAGGISKLAVTGTTGTLTVNESTHNIVVANTDVTGPNASAQLDLSGLGTFNATIANVYVGRATSAAGAATNGRPLDTLTLASTNNITASGVVAVGGSSQSFQGTGTLLLGTSNVINAGSFVIGVSRTTGTLQFNTGLTNPSVTLRGAAGGASTTNMYLGDQFNSRGLAAGGGGSTVISGTADFTAGKVDALIGTLVVGDGATNAGANGIGAGNGAFSFGGASANQAASTVSINSLVIGQTQDDTSTATTGVTKVTSAGTFTMNSGTLAINTSATIASDADNVGGNTVQSVTGSFSLAGGTATIGSVATPVNVTFGNHTGTGTGAATATMTLTGGSLTVNGDLKQGTLSAGSIASSLTLNGASLDMAGHNIGTAGALLGTLNFQSGTLQNVAQINAGAGLTKSGTGTLTLAGANTYTGGTAINNGTLKLGASTALPSTTTVTLGSGATNGTLDLAGFNASVGGLATAGTTAASQVIGNSSTAADAKLTFLGQVASSFGGSIQDVIAAGTHATALTVTGSQPLTLTGNNAYSGETDITDGGQLFVSNTPVGGVGSGTGSGAVKVFKTTTGGTLGGSGTIAGPVTLSSGGTVTAGTSATDTTKVGTLSGLGTLTVQNGSTYAWKINDATGTAGATAAGWDLLSFAALDFSGLTANGLTVQLTGQPAHFDPNGSYTWKIAAAPTITGFAASDFIVDSGQFTSPIAADHAFAVTSTGTEVDVTYQAVPEPTTLGVLALGVLALGQRRRRQLA